MKQQLPEMVDLAVRHAGQAKRAKVCLYVNTTPVWRFEVDVGHPLFAGRHGNVLDMAKRQVRRVLRDSTITSVETIGIRAEQEERLVLARECKLFPAMTESDREEMVAQLMYWFMGWVETGGGAWGSCPPIYPKPE